MISVLELFRSVVDCSNRSGHTLGREELAGNWDALSSSGINVGGDKACSSLFSFLSEHWAKYGTPPELEYIRSHFTNSDPSETVLAAIEQMAAARPTVGSSFRATVESYVEECQAEELSKALVKADRIARLGVVEGIGRTRKELRGLADAVSYLESAVPIIASRSIGNAEHILEKARVVPPPLEWIVQNYLARGQVSVTAGDAGVGKTLLDTALAIQMTTEEYILDGTYAVTQPIRVLWIEGDLAASVYASKYVKPLGGKWDGTEGVSFVPVSEIPGFDLASPASIGILEGLIKKSDADYVVLDSYASLCTRPENESKDVLPVLQALKRLAERTGTHIRLIHHMRKPSVDAKRSPRTMNDMIGSSAFSRLSDYVLGVSAKLDDEGRVIKRSGTIEILKEGSLGGIMTFPRIDYEIRNTPDGKVHIDLKPATELPDPDVIDRDVLLFVKSNPRCSRKDLIANLPHPARTIEYHVKKLADKGSLERIGSTSNMSYSVSDGVYIDMGFTGMDISSIAGAL